MIRYTLVCADRHEFEGWFRSATDFDQQNARGLISCPDCGCADIRKALMAPSVSRKAATRPQPPSDAPAPPAAATHAPQSPPAPQSPSAPQTPPDPAALREALSALRRHVEANSDYVGENFAREARAMHRDEAPVRAIHGEATADEAKALLEEGIDVAPLPFVPRRQQN